MQEIPSSLENCGQCHGGPTSRNRIFGSFPPRNGAAYLQSDPEGAAAWIVKKKEASSEWKSYLRLRAVQDKLRN